MKYDKSAVYRMEQDRYGKQFILQMKQAYHEINILPLLHTSCAGKPSPRILEFGPGLGELTKLLLQKYPNAEYHVIDVDNDILAMLQKTHPGVHIHNIQNINEYEKQDFTPFDVILGLDVWEHLPSKQLEKYTQKSIQLLTNNGIFIAQVPNWGCPFGPNIFANDLTHVNRFNEFSATQLLLNAGAERESLEILPYRFPTGAINFLRTLLRGALLFLYKNLLFILGVQRFKIMTPNLIMVVRT